MTIRDAIAADLAAIFELEHRPENHTFIATWTEGQHAKMFAAEESAYIVAEDDAGDVVGYAILLNIHSPDSSVELKRLVVASPGKGLGRKLLAFVAHRVFAEYRAHRLYLDVYEANPRAKHVYDAFGFVVEGMVREASYRDGKYQSLTLMSLLDREYRALHQDTRKIC